MVVLEEIMEHYYKQPLYFSKFKCIGGDCPESCCGGWQVFWKTSELENLKKADVSEDLKHTTDESFSYVKDKECYQIKLCDDGRCPFHDRETDLCNIQREVGEKYLGTVCKQYPRHYIENSNQIIRWCATSCPAVIDILFNDEYAMDVEMVLARDQDKLDRTTITVDTVKAVSLDPMRKIRIPLFDFYTELLLDKSRDIEISIIVTALAVKHLTDAEKKGNYVGIPEIIGMLKKMLSTPDVVKSLSEIQPNYQLKFKLVNNMLVKFFRYNPNISNISALHNGNELVTERYLTGLENFYAAFDNNKFVLKNVIMNTFYDMNLPLGKYKRTLFENYSFFVLAAASFKTVAATVGYCSKNIKEDFKICVAEMSRGFSHDIHRGDEMIEEMIQMGLTTPAHLALIIK